MSKNFEGYGGKRPLLYINYKRLNLDPKNPRLPAEAQDKKEDIIIESLRKNFFLEELATSMAENGYFDEEPLVGIPKDLPKEYEGKKYDELKNDKQYSEFIENPKTEFIILEGNRRLCTVKLLHSGEINNFPKINSEIKKDLIELPVIIYPRRRDVISYIGARHIIGVKKWDAFAKARYIANMKDDYGLTLDEIQKSVGDTSNSAKKTYACYKLIAVMETEFENYDTSKAKDNFSYLMLALGQGPVKDFLGLPKQWGNVDSNSPVPNDKHPNLFYLFSWLFGEGKEKPKVIEESRDITGKLTAILRDIEATEYLKQHRDINEAYDRCGGEGQLLIKYLKRANRDLGRAMPFISNPKNNNEEVSALIENCERSLESMKKISGS